MGFGEKNIILIVYVPEMSNIHNSFSSVSANHKFPAQIKMKEILHDHQKEITLSNITSYMLVKLQGHELPLVWSPAMYFG